MFAAGRKGGEGRQEEREGRGREEGGKEFRDERRQKTEGRQSRQLTTHSQATPGVQEGQNEPKNEG